MKKFPKMLYVKRDQDGSETYFVPQDNVNDVAEMGVTTQVGIYQLVGTQNVRGVAETQRMRKL